MANENSDIEKRTDYENVMKEFGIASISDLETKLPKDHLFFRRDIVFAHRDFNQILKYQEENKEWAIISGRGPSNDLHIGHLLVFELIRFLQEKYNCHFFMPLSNDEKYVFRKINNLENSYQIALDNAIDIFALGFNPDKVHAYISSMYPRIYYLAVKFSVNLTYNAAKAAFGYTGEENLGKIFYSSIQAAHILQPTVDFDYPVVVPIGLDQDVYMRVTRDIARRQQILLPSSLYVRYLMGITGGPMSSSIPETCVYLRDDEKTVKKKIMSAFTGGRATIKEQRELGGVPEVCAIYDWFQKFFIEDDKQLKEIYNKCRNGELICGMDCKPRLVKLFLEFQAKHNENKKKVIAQLPKYFEHEIDISMLNLESENIDH